MAARRELVAAIRQQAEPLSSRLASFSRAILADGTQLVEGSFGHSATRTVSSGCSCSHRDCHAVNVLPPRRPAGVISSGQRDSPAAAFLSTGAHASSACGLPWSLTAAAGPGRRGTGREVPTWPPAAAAASASRRTLATAASGGGGDGRQEADGGASSAGTSTSGGGGAVGQIQPRLLMTFTCSKCDTRSTKGFSKQSYTQGVVLVRCPGCKKLHLIADHLGWFGEEPFMVHQHLQQTGGNVVVVTAEEGRSAAPQEAGAGGEGSGGAGADPGVAARSAAAAAAAQASTDGVFELGTEQQVLGALEDARALARRAKPGQPGQPGSQ
ncbi:hypothetical protein HYH03_014700 [Edaphochlamys debaryana]|uniref:DNL-type domain-containing protein n=1 Tax=Edaphochlamys debaryana TaxID=47281 RepID=A0A835XN88_9CHLO|nr:hypothetical protein HYH03_014700 [Edaphochlamys debaryana]|eukprot:KAG2486644.1 hypothetical protein HYH03_014700 [Edaphochlamys debaryana]